MSEKQYKWKQINQTPPKLQRLISRSKQLPHPFRPTKIRSESVDRTLNLQRSNIYSNSIERSHLNISRDDNSVQKERGLLRKQKKQQPNNELEVLRKEVQRLNTINLTHKQTSIASDTIKKMSDIKKQFLAFKQNVIQELERQKNMVNQLVKDVLMTLEFQLQKLGKQTSPQVNLNGKGGEISVQNFEQLTTSLQNKSILSTQKNSSVTNNLQKIQNKKQVPVNKESEPILLPPSSPLNISNFLGSIEKLKTEINQMDTLIEGITPSKKAVPST